MIVRVKDIEITIGNRKSGDQGTYVGRPTALGNPYSTFQGRMSAIQQYRKWLQEKLKAEDRTVCTAMERLRQEALRERSLKLVCWCAPKPCHAEVIAEELAKALSTNTSFGGPT